MALDSEPGDSSLSHGRRRLTRASVDPPVSIARSPSQRAQMDAGSVPTGRGMFPPPVCLYYVISGRAAGFAHDRTPWLTSGFSRGRLLNAHGLLSPIVNTHGERDGLMRAPPSAIVFVVNHQLLGTVSP